MTHETFVSMKNLQDVLDGIEQKIAGLGSTLTGIYTWQANNQYKAGDVCILNGSLFICLSTHTSSSAFSTDVANWKLVYSDIDEWASSTYYVKGASVIANNAMYKCKTTHTSGSTFDSTEEANWDITVGTSGNVKIKNWETSTQYKQYDVIMVNNNLYRCVSNHTSTTFSSDISNWELIYASIGNWQASTYYSVGVFAINDKKLYRCKTQHTSGSTFSDTNWDLLSGGSGAEIDDWATSTQYKVGDLVIRENNLYRCKTAHTSSSFNTDITNWIKLDNIPDWKQNTYYAVGDYLYYDKNLYKVVTAFTSSTTFSATNLEMLGGTPLTTAEETSIINNFSPQMATFNNVSNLYTTTERAIGIWIDGKTIYQKTYSGTTPSTANTNIDIFVDSNLANVKTLVSMDGVIDDSGTLYVINESEERSVGFTSRIWLAKSVPSLRGKLGTSLVSKPIHITIKYTKV